MLKDTSEHMIVFDCLLQFCNSTNQVQDKEYLVRIATDSSNIL